MLKKSGTTGVFLCTQSLFEIFIKNKGICVTIPDGNKIISKNTVIFYLPYLPMEVRKAHVFEQLENELM